MNCHRCGPVHEDDAMWVTDHRETRETPEEGHYECPNCHAELEEDDVR